MLKVENTDVYSWEAAIRGMRSPMNSWDKSDSYEGFFFEDEFNEAKHNGEIGKECVYKQDFIQPFANYVIGENDLKLMKTLSKAGNDHGKFLRMINVTCDITAPLYWWKEFDTYKVGTVANSCSTMHKIHAKEFTLDDFSHEHLADSEDEYMDSMDVLEEVINIMNLYREKFIKYHEKCYWWQMIQLLPTSYNQKRTVQLNYQVLKSMYFARQNHKLDEWHTLCEWMETLPYFKEIVLED